MIEARLVTYVTLAHPLSLICVTVEFNFLVAPHPKAELPVAMTSA